MNVGSEVLWWIGGGLLALLLLGYALLRKNRPTPSASAFEDEEDQGLDDREEML